MKRTFSIIIIVCWVLAACRATPEKKIVVNKNEGQMLEIINESKPSEQNLPSSDSNEKQYYEAPEYWKETFPIFNEEARVVVDANIIIPKVDKFPVIEVEPDKFTIEDFKLLEKLFMPECEYYLDRPTLTKSQIESMVVDIQRSIDDPNSSFNTKIKGQENYQILLEEKQEDIKTLKELHKTAPENTKEEPIIITQEYLNNNELARVLAQSKETSKVMAYVWMNANEYEKKRINAVMMYPTYNYKTLEQGTEYISPVDTDVEAITPPPLTITQDVAIKLAEETVSALGIDDMQMNYCYLKQNDYEGSYEVFFTKTYDGVPLTYTLNDTGSDTGMTESVYSYPWRSERLHLSINDCGVTFLNWISPSKEVETLASDVQLLPYDTIVGNLKNQLEYKYTWIDDDSELGKDIINRNIYITEISLGMMRVSIKDTVDRYMVIPVWDFFGYYSNIYPEGYEDAKHLNLNEYNEAFFYKEMQAHSLITINAIDGSVIDRSLGY